MNATSANLNPRSIQRRASGIRSLAAATLLLGLGGCVVAPLGPGYHTPAGAVYVAPTYAIPGPGYVWGHNARHGWGWRHPRRGWHRGWH